MFGNFESQMNKWVRAGVIVLFFGWLCSSLAVVNKIEIGLDQVMKIGFATVSSQWRWILNCLVT